MANRFRYSLRALTCALLLVGSVLGVVGHVVVDGIRQRNTANRLRQAGADVEAETPWLSTLGFAALLDVQQIRKVNARTPFGTSVLMENIESIPSVVSVTVVGSGFDSRELRRLLARTRVTELTLDSTSVPDEEIAHLAQDEDSLGVIKTYRWAHELIDEIRAPVSPDYNPLSVVRAVNQLRGSGKENAVNTIAEYLRQHSNGTADEVMVLVALSFERNKPKELLPRPQEPEEDPQYVKLFSAATSGKTSWDKVRAYRQSIDGRYNLVLREWPVLRSVVVAGDIPFSADARPVMQGSRTSDESSQYLVEWCRRHARLIENPLVPSSEPGKCGKQVREHARLSGMNSDRLAILETSLDRQCRALLASASKQQSFKLGRVDFGLKWDVVRQAYVAIAPHGRTSKE